ncbi:phage tail tape measure protein [Catonella massiliensis]|uniref:Phage tail tape measure protein n=1 Tax=Catonella massiliensis TaxID=2799636 RepID=A0ABS1J3D1_9FIRM|nr:phage tail tape measure protein [Catonella massiliensis]MBK5898668.1 phage tail tape measure protein [Catonella massiliensis]
MGKIVDVTLRLVDKMSSPLRIAGTYLQDNARQWMKAGKQIERSGKAIAGVGANLTKTVTAPIAGIGVASVKLAADFEKGMSTVQSISGATGTDLEMLSKKAKEMGLKTKYSASESAEAFKYMAMAGWKAGEMADGIEGVMYLAGATGEDLAGTSDIVTDALTAFGMQAKDTNKFVDVLAQTANKSNTSVSMLGESFKYVAPVAGALKFNAQDVSTALGLMANSGIKASSAGTALRSLFTRMAKPTKESQTAMDALGISLTDSKGNMKSLDTIMRETRKSFAGLTESQKAQYAAALAGKTGMSGLLAIVNSADSDFNELSTAIYNSDGACKKMYDTANNNLSGQLTILKSTIEGIGISFGERLLPYIKQGTEFIQRLADKFNSPTKAQQDTIIKVGLIAAAVGPAIFLFGRTVMVVGKLVKTVGMVGNAFKTAKTVMGLVTAPANAVVLGLAAVVVAGVLIYKNWDKIKAAAGRLWNFVKNIFQRIGISGDSLKKKLAPIGQKFSAIGEHIQGFWKVVSPLLSKIGEAVHAVFSVLIGAAIGSAIGYFNSLFDGITTMISGLLTAFDGIITFITGVFTLNWSKAWEGVKNIFGGIFEGLGGMLKMPINGVISMINGAIAGINSISVDIPDWVPGIGGEKFGINIPQLPMLARGTDNWKGGFAQISEKGGEIVDLPSGARVYPHDETVRKAYADGAKRNDGKSVYIAKLADSIVVKSESDIDKIAEALAKKIFETSDNMGGEEIGYIY